MSTSLAAVEHEATAMCCQKTLKHGLQWLAMTYSVAAQIRAELGERKCKRNEPCQELVNMTSVHSLVQEKDYTMVRTRKTVSTFSGLPLELKQALRAAPPVETSARMRSASVVEDGRPDSDLYLETQRPTKRARIGDTSEQSVVSSSSTVAVLSSSPRTLVPFYADEDAVPSHLAKYWHQRERLFSRYDEGCLLDEEGWYSVTPERIATQIAERCACNVILDAFCGVGGNAIAFAQTCERVIAIDNSPTRLALARHNATIYGVADRIEFVLGDFLDFARVYSSRDSSPIDVVFLSPPWGGPSYLASSPKKLASNQSSDEYLDESAAEYSLAAIQPCHGAPLFAIARLVTHNIAYFLPRNTDPHEIAQLTENLPDGQSSVEIEEEWMGNKLKALTCYFGGLAQGQERLFDQRPQHL